MERQAFEESPGEIMRPGTSSRSLSDACSASQVAQKTPVINETIPCWDSHFVCLSEEEVNVIGRHAYGGVGNVQEVYPLTPAQEGILFQVHATASREDPYVVRVVFSIPSEASLLTFTAALQNVIDRYDALRTTVVWRGLSRPIQVVHRTIALPISRVSLEGGMDPFQWIMRLPELQAQRLDAGSSPLIRAHVASSNGYPRCCLLLEMHHIICDAQSLYCMFAEVIACLEGRARRLVEPIPFREYVERTLKAESSATAKAFFGMKLRGIAGTTAPFGLVEVNNDGTNVVEAREELQPHFSKKLRALATSMKVFSGAIVHAACALVVAHTSARTDIVFGTVMLGRLHASTDPQRTQGMYINTLPLRVQLQSLSCRQLVTQIQRELLEFLVYEHASLALARQGSDIKGSGALFTALVNYKSSTVDWMSEWARVGIVPHIMPQRTNYSVTFNIDDRATSLHLAAETDRRIDPGHVLRHLRLGLISLMQALEYAPDVPALRLISRLEVEP